MPTNLRSFSRLAPSPSTTILHSLPQKAPVSSTHTVSCNQFLPDLVKTYLFSLSYPLTPTFPRLPFYIQLISSIRLTHMWAPENAPILLVLWTVYSILLFLLTWKCCAVSDYRNQLFNSGHSTIVEMLLDNKVDYTSSDSNGATPLHYAAQNNFPVSKSYDHLSICCLYLIFSLTIDLTLWLPISGIPL